VDENTCCVWGEADWTAEGLGRGVAFEDGDCMIGVGVEEGDCGAEAGYAAADYEDVEGNRHG